MVGEPRLLSCAAPESLPECYAHTSRVCGTLQKAGRPPRGPSHRRGTQRGQPCPL